MTLAKDQISVMCQHFQKGSTLKLLGQFYLNFICSLQEKGAEIFIFGPGHMAKIDAMPIYGKTL